MKVEEFIKKNSRYILLITLFSIGLIFLNSTILGIFACMTNLLINIILLKKIIEQKTKDEAKNSAYFFLYSFLDNIQTGKSGKNAYEQALPHLIGHQEAAPYEEVLQEPTKLSLYDYNDDFARIIQKENESELHLADYRPLLDDIECKINALSAKNKSIKKNIISILTIGISTVLIIGYLLQINKALSEAMSQNIYKIGIFILSICLTSIPMFLVYRRMER